MAGTLIRPEPSVAQQYREAALDVSGSRILPSGPQIERRFQTAFQHVDLPGGGLRYGTTRAEGLWFWKRVAGSVFPRLNNQELTELTRALFRRFEQASAWAIFPEARHVLKMLRSQGVTLALLSNWDARGPDLLRNLGLHSVFSVRVFSSDLGHEKPDPDIFDQVVKRLDESFQRILMIGNHVEIDLEEPDRRGWETILFTPGSEDEWPREVSGWEDVPDEILVPNS